MPPLYPKSLNPLTTPSSLNPVSGNSGLQGVWSGLSWDFGGRTPKDRPDVLDSKVQEL